jgi:hypothetical protein
MTYSSHPAASWAHCRRSVQRDYAQSETVFTSVIGGDAGTPTQTVYAAAATYLSTSGRISAIEISVLTIQCPKNQNNSLFSKSILLFVNHSASIFKSRKSDFAAGCGSFGSSTASSISNLRPPCFLYLSFRGSRLL